MPTTEIASPAEYRRKVSDAFAAVDELVAAKDRAVHALRAVAKYESIPDVDAVQRRMLIYVAEPLRDLADFIDNDGDGSCFEFQSVEDEARALRVLFEAALQSGGEDA